MTSGLFRRVGRGLASAALVMAVVAVDPAVPIPLAEPGLGADGGPAAPAAALDGRPAALEEVLAEARRTTRLIDGRVTVRQLYEVHAFGGTWRFEAQVTKEDRAVLVEVRGAPWFVPPRLELALVEAFDLLEGYEPVLAGWQRAPSGRPVWVVDARPRSGRPGAARRVRFWVEQDTGQVTHLELAYPWGNLVIDQSYRRVGPYTVLERQQVAIQPLGIRVDVRYRDYRFGPPAAAGPAASSSISEKSTE